MDFEGEKLVRRDIESESGQECLRRIKLSKLYFMGF